MLAFLVISVKKIMPTRHEANKNPLGVGPTKTTERGAQ